MVDISEPIYEIIGHLISAEATENKETQFNINWQYRLISSYSNLRELNVNKTYFEENIQDGEILVILSPQTLRFSNKLKTSHIYLENKRKIALKLDNDEQEFCLAEPPIKFGKRYFEIILESEPLAKNIMIGITKKRNNFSFNDSKDFYGYILSECKSVCNLNNKVELKDYGIPTKMGDKIGVLLDLGDSSREISFYVNDSCLGIAFKDLPMDYFYPCVCLGYSGTKVRINSKVDFPGN